MRNLKLKSIKKLSILNIFTYDMKYIKKINYFSVHCVSESIRHLYLDGKTYTPDYNIMLINLLPKVTGQVYIKHFDMSGDGLELVMQKS